MASEDMINKIIENIPSSKMNSEEDMFHYIVNNILSSKSDPDVIE